MIRRKEEKELAHKEEVRELEEADNEMDRDSSKIEEILKKKIRF